MGEDVAQILFHLAKLHSFDTKPVAQVQTPAPKPALSGEDLKAEGFKDGRALGGTLNELHDWAMWHGKNTKADGLKQLKAFKEMGETVLVVPDLHGNIDAFKALMESEHSKNARAIISLGDYLDANDDDPKKTRIIETAQYID